jgi:hypothetical protein
MPLQPSSSESFLARSHQVLRQAGTVAGTRVHRGRPDAYAYGELPAINQRRADSQHTEFATGVDHCMLEMELDLIAGGDEWETTVDRLHREAHAALLADAELAALGDGLRCARVRTGVDSGDVIVGRLVATYQVQQLVDRTTLLAHPR